LYPGTAYFNLTFANDTVRDLPMQAVYSAGLNFTPGITGADVYRKQVKLPPAPVSCGPSSTATSATATSASATASTVLSTPTFVHTGLSKLRPPYPQNPVVVQKNLLTPQPPAPNAGYLTSYFINESSLAVLSVPSFGMTGVAPQGFSDVIAEFLSLSKESGMKKLLIDLQGNGGGTALLADELFKHVKIFSEPLSDATYLNILSSSHKLPPFKAPVFALGRR
jgi:hypothetical protein